MAPLLQLSTYTEEISSAGRGRPSLLRPTSVYRRNNPHPKPDFLLPRKLQTSHGASQVSSSPRPHFPPIRHLSFHNPADGKRAHLLSAVDADPTEKAPLNSSRLHMLPPAGWVRKTQMTDPSGTSAQLQPPLRNIQSQMASFKSSQQRPGPLSAIQRFPGDYRHSSLGPRRHSGTEPLKGHQHTTTTTNNNKQPAARHLPQIHYRRSHCTPTSLDPCAGYSCFHVVKPYQAGYYIIHPEFASESLR